MTRTAPFVGSPLYGGHLRDNQSESGQVASARIPRTIGGNNRLYYEMLRGNTLTNQSPCSQRNSRGLLGEDHSGASFGRPIINTFWSLAMADPADSSGSGLHHPPQGKGPVAFRKIFLNADFDIFVPSCAPGGCYESATLDVSLHVITAGGTTGGEDGDSQIIVTLNDTSTTFNFDITSTGYYDQDDTVILKPGTYNRMHIRFDAYASGSYNITMLGIALSQTESS